MSIHFYSTSDDIFIHQTSDRQSNVAPLVFSCLKCAKCQLNWHSHVKNPNVPSHFHAHFSRHRLHALCHPKMLLLWGKTTEITIALSISTISKRVIRFFLFEEYGKSVSLFWRFYVKIADTLFGKVLFCHDSHKVGRPLLCHSKAMPTQRILTLFGPALQQNLMLIWWMFQSFWYRVQARSSRPLFYLHMIVFPHVDPLKSTPQQDIVMIQLFCHGSLATFASAIILPEYKICSIITYPTFHLSVGILYEKVFKQNRKNRNHKWKQYCWCSQYYEI